MEDARLDNIAREMLTLLFILCLFNKSILKVMRKHSYTFATYGLL